MAEGQRSSSRAEVRRELLASVAGQAETAPTACKDQHGAQDQGPAAALNLGTLDKWSLRDHIRFTQSSTGGKRVLDYFREMDADGSGSLSRVEFGTAIRNMGFVAATDEQIDGVWAVCDADGSGTILYKELDNILRRIGPRPDIAPALAEEAPPRRKKERDRFPRPLDPDAAFAQPTFSQISPLKQWRQRETSSQPATPRAWDGYSSMGAKPRSPRSSMRELLHAQLAENPDSSLALVLLRASGRVSGTTLAPPTPAEEPPPQTVSPPKSPVTKKRVLSKSRKPDTSHLDPWTLREFLRFSNSSNGGKRVIDAFREMDKDDSGELDRTEFGSALRNMGFVAATDAEIDHVWTVCDADGSGGIPYKELDTILRTIGPKPNPAEAEALRQQAEMEAKAAASRLRPPTRQEQKHRALIGAAMVLHQYRQAAPRGHCGRLDVVHIRERMVLRARQRLGLPGRADALPRSSTGAHRRGRSDASYDQGRPARRRPSLRV